MSKLIDADALMEPLDQWAQEMRETWQSNVRMSFLLAGMVQKVEELTVNLPDASVPLRKRIAELEEALRVNADLVRDYALYDNPTPEQVENGLMMSANVLLKGDQDA